MTREDIMRLEDYLVQQSETIDAQAKRIDELEVEIKERDALQERNEKLEVIISAQANLIEFLKVSHCRDWECSNIQHRDKCDCIWKKGGVES